MEYKINVPEDCELIVTREGHNAIIEIVPKEPVFKENDIVVSYLKNNESISIFSGYYVDNKFESKSAFNVQSECFITENVDVLYDKIRFATDSEKQLLFDKLKEKCLMFDGENVVRWRAAPYKKYFYLPGDGDIAETEDDMSNWDDGAYYIGNYFPTREMAEAFQKVYIESLNNFHKNL